MAAKGTAGKKAEKVTAADVPRLLDDFIAQAGKNVKNGFHYNFDAKKLKAGAALLTAPKPIAAAAVAEALDRFLTAATAPPPEEPDDAPAPPTRARRREFEQAAEKLAEAEGITRWAAKERLREGEFADLAAAERAESQLRSVLPASEFSDPQIGAVAALLDKLLRRVLPLEADLLARLADEVAEAGFSPHDEDPPPGARPWGATLTHYGNPFLGLAKQAEGFLKAHGQEAVTNELRHALRRAASHARDEHASWKPLNKYAVRLEAVAGPDDSATRAEPRDAPPDLPPEPTPTGELLSLAPDNYEIAADDPLLPLQELITRYLADVDRHLGNEPGTLVANEGERDYWLWNDWSIGKSAAGRAMLEGEPEDRAWVLIAGLRRFRHLADRLAEARGRTADLYMDHSHIRTLWALLDNSYAGEGRQRKHHLRSSNLR
ncbi:MAG: hypothetical protein AAF907_11460 [Planctomycetota bacterium]